MIVLNTTGKKKKKGKKGESGALGLRVSVGLDKQHQKRTLFF